MLHILLFKTKGNALIHKIEQATIAIIPRKDEQVCIEGAIYKVVSIMWVYPSKAIQNDDVQVLITITSI